MTRVLTFFGNIYSYSIQKVSFATNSQYVDLQVHHGYYFRRDVERTCRLKLSPRAPHSPEGQGSLFAAYGMLKVPVDQFAMAGGVQAQLDSATQRLALFKVDRELETKVRTAFAEFFDLAGNDDTKKDIPGYTNKLIDMVGVVHTLSNFRKKFRIHKNDDPFKVDKELRAVYTELQEKYDIGVHHIKTKVMYAAEILKACLIRNDVCVD